MSDEIRVPPAWKGKMVLARWYVPDGSVVVAGSPICELETEHANVDLPASLDGVIEHVVPRGTDLQPGDLVGRLNT